jgi:hypothetical protein
MKKFKGTEEEWVQGATFFSEEDEQPVYWIDIRVGDNKIAQVNGIHYGIPNEECVANAKLIAAAPELLNLAMLVNRISSRKSMPTEMEMLLFQEQSQKAINKAL